MNKSAGSMDVGDFGALEKDVRWLEEVAPGDLVPQLERRLSKRKVDIAKMFLTSALAAARSIRPEGHGPIPVSHSLIGLRAAADTHEFLQAAEAPSKGESPGSHRVILRALRSIKDELAHPGRTPFRLPDPGEAPSAAKEDLVFRFLEAVHAGDPDQTDALFSWIVRDMEREQATDLLLSAGLEGVTCDLHAVVSAVETLGLLDRVGWEWATVLLRPVVRQQTVAVGRSADYEACIEEVAARQLLRAARRRAPGRRSLGEEDPEEFFRWSREWAQCDPENRRVLVGTALAAGVTLEDTGEIVALGTTMLFLQEGLRSGAKVWSEAQADRRMHLVTGGHSMVRLIRLGTPGQRILGLLLTGCLPGIRDVRLDPSQPEASWWLSPASRLHTHVGERSAETEAAGNGEDLAPPAVLEWRAALQEKEPNRLLPILTRSVERGDALESFAPSLAREAVEQEVGGALPVKLERCLAELYEGSRTPYRWLHLWASGLSQTLWPSVEGNSGVLQTPNTSVRMPEGLG